MLKYEGLHPPDFLACLYTADIEHNKFCCQVSTIMKAILNKDGDLLSQFDSINANDIPILERISNLPPQITDTRQQKMLLRTVLTITKIK